MKQLVTNILLCLLILVFSYFLLSSFLPYSSGLPFSILTVHMNMREHPTEAMSVGESPVVMTNTMIDISKNGMEKRSYISDTCGNFSKSTYDMTIHSSPFSIFGATSGVTIDSCLPYQIFVPDSSGGRFGQCQNQCTGNQYFDITNRSCMLCPIGYINDGNNQCVPLETCPRGFKYTDHSGNCNTCPLGKKFDDGIHCVDICLEPYKELGADGNCKMKCPSRNDKWDPNANNGRGGCVSCGIGMVDNGRNQCIALPPCPEGMHFNSDSKCVSQCQDYERYNPLANQCQKICSPTQKFDKNTGLCVECPSGFQSNVDDAYSCKAIPVQKKTCEPGYDLNSKNVCVSICLDDKKNNPLEPTTCVPKCPPNSIYMPDTSCKYCEYGNSVNNVCPGPPQAPPVADATHEIIKGASYEKCPTWTTRSRSNPSICTPFCTGNTKYSSDGTCIQCNAGYVSNNDINQCQKICPAWQILSTTSNDLCVDRCLDKTKRWDSEISDCVPCGDDYFGVDSSNVCIFKPKITGTTINVGSPPQTTMIGGFSGATNTTKVNITIQRKSGDTYTDVANYNVDPSNGTGSYTFIGLSQGATYRMRYIPYNGSKSGTTYLSSNKDTTAFTPSIGLSTIVAGSPPETTMIGGFTGATNCTKVNITIQKYEPAYSPDNDRPDLYVPEHYVDLANYDVTPQNGTGSYTFTGLSQGATYRMSCKPYNGSTSGTTVFSSDKDTKDTTPSIAKFTLSISPKQTDPQGISSLDVYFSGVKNSKKLTFNIQGKSGNEFVDYSKDVTIDQWVDGNSLFVYNGVFNYGNTFRGYVTPYNGNIKGETIYSNELYLDTRIPGRSSTISTIKGCYGAHTPEYNCGGWKEECEYTCVGDYCAYSGTIKDCNCNCDVCAAFYPDLYLDSATGKCVNDAGIPASGSPGSGTKVK